MQHQRAFTLIELLIAIVLVGVLLALAAPGFRDFILLQRLKGVNAQLVTDLQFARSDAASRGFNVQLQFRAPTADSAMSCYALYVDTSADPRLKCDCSQPPGARCLQPTTTEIRTVQVPLDLGVRLDLPPEQEAGFAFVANSGGIRIGAVEVAGRLDDFVVLASIDSVRQLRTNVGRSGRPSVCSPGGGVTGVSAC